MPNGMCMRVGVCMGVDSCSPNLEEKDNSVFYFYFRGGGGATDPMHPLF